MSHHLPNNIHNALNNPDNPDTDTIAAAIKEYGLLQKKQGHAEMAELMQHYFRIEAERHKSRSHLENYYNLRDRIIKLIDITTEKHNQ